METGKKIVLFDGVCNLCEHSVQWIIKHDHKDEFRFATLQGALGSSLLKERKIDITQIDSIVLIEPGMAYYTKSDAALKIATSFGGVWKLLVVLNLIPSKLRNIVYDWVAKNRYTWYGKKEQCLIPTPALKAKFLD